MKVYSVLDTKVGSFGLPFFCLHDALAKRIVCEACADERTTLAKYPSDFVLMRIGGFDQSTGGLLSETPVNLGVVGAIFSAEFAQSRASARSANVEA